MSEKTKNPRFLSRMGARGTLGQAILDLADEGNDFFAVSADLGNASGFTRLQNEHSKKYINIGISEQNMLSIAAGLTKTGVPVFASTFAPFATYRCLDQIRNFMGYMKMNIKLIGLDSGVTKSTLGGSHFGLEDISVIRSIPNITVISPSDDLSLYETIHAAYAYDGPVYIRMTGGQTVPMIYKKAIDNFEFGKAIQLRDGNDVMIISCGTITEKVLKAADILSEKGISCSVADMHTIKPIDQEFLKICSSKYKLIVTVEEHTVCGGLGGAVAESMSEFIHKPPHMIIGVNDFSPSAGTYEYILETCGLTSDIISDKICSKFNEIIK